MTTEIPVLGCSTECVKAGVCPAARTWRDDERSQRLVDPERLEALKMSGLLTRPVAKRLEHLCFTATTLLAADASQINALDQFHQFTAVGYPPSDWPVFPLENAGCREVVVTGEPFAVQDTRINPVTCNMPWTKDFRGYLGAPVRYQGHVLGSICVLSVEPRRWLSYETTALEGIARLVGMSLDGPRRV